MNNSAAMSSSGTVGKENSPILLDREEILGRKRVYWRIRRIQDIVLSGLALVVFSFPMAVIALIVFIDSPGASPMFSQIRIGRDGKPFRLYKFRTMIPDAEAYLPELLKENEMDGPVFKIRQDPRITRFGRWLRRCSLDELPQLLNILKGDMSFVGPRPALPREVSRYGAYERQRLIVTPGLTCYWQIQPRRNAMSFAQWLELDLKYIRERNFFLDWKLIFMTVGAVIRGDGE